MRSQKQVRRIAKVRSMKNAAAGKWKAYQKRREARKAWQNNTILTKCQRSRNMLTPAPLKQRRNKEPKQRSPEQLAERRRLREQRRLEKRLTKQRASTSTLLESKKQKKLGKLATNGPKKAPNEQKIAPKATKTRHSTKEETAKAKLLMNEQAQCAVNLEKGEAPKKVSALKEVKVSKLQSESKSKQQQIKAAKTTLIEEPKMSHSSAALELEQEELVNSTKRAVAAYKTNKKSLEKDELAEEVVKKEKDGKVQLLDSNHVTESQELVAPTLLHSVAKGDVHEMDYEETKADYVGIADGKGKGRGKQQSKSVKITGKDRNANKMITEEEATILVSSMNKKIKYDHSLNSDVRSNAKGNTAHDSSKENMFVKEKEIVQPKQAVKQKNQIDVLESTEQVGRISEERGNKRNQRSDVVSITKGGTARDSSKGKSRAKENETVQLKQVANKKDQTDGREGIEVEKISELKNQRNQRSNPNSFSSQYDFVKEDTREIDEAKANFMEMVDEKMTGRKKQQSKSVKINGKDRNANDMITKEANFVVTYTNQDKTSCEKETKYKANLEKKNPLFSLPQFPDLNHAPPPMRGRVYKLLPRDVDYCIRMIEKHGEDYEAMAKDQGNVFGDSAKGIARKIRVFKESPEYEVYSRQKAERNDQVA